MHGLHPPKRCLCEHHANCMGGMYVTFILTAGDLLMLYSHFFLHIGKVFLYICIPNLVNERCALIHEFWEPINLFLISFWNLMSAINFIFGVYLHKFNHIFPTLWTKRPGRFMIIRPLIHYFRAPHIRVTKATWAILFAWINIIASAPVTRAISLECCGCQAIFQVDVFTATKGLLERLENRLEIPLVDAGHYTFSTA